jgi:hypothetical protein
VEEVTLGCKVVEYVRIDLEDGTYMPIVFSNDDMATLGSFFTTDVVCFGDYWDKWIVDPSEDSEEISGNITYLEKEDGNIYLSFLYDESDEITRLKISPQNLLELLDYWRKNVSKIKPKYVFISGENGIYTMKSSDRDPLL